MFCWHRYANTQNQAAYLRQWGKTIGMVRVTRTKAWFIGTDTPTHKTKLHICASGGFVGTDTSTHKAKLHICASKN